MKLFTRKISAILVATLLLVTVVPNFAFANDNIDVALQVENVAEMVQTTEGETETEASAAEESAEPVVVQATEDAIVSEASPVTEDSQKSEAIQSSEKIPVAESEPTQENAADDIGGNVTVQSEKTVKGTNYKADEAIITPENLTVLLRGLDDSNKKETMLIIDKYLNTVVQQSKPVNITGDTFVDAEKFSVGTPGLDSQHCWAATASNILWTTGYAQQAVNPQTGKHFMSEDEVLAYFTANFTDNPGIPSDGIDWFMKGTGAYTLQQYKNVSHYTDPASGGLLSSVNASSSMLQLWNVKWDDKKPNENKSTPDKINSLLSVCSQGMGVLVKWYENKKISDSAHWMTVVGTIIDRTANTLENKYKALILADSDNNPVHREAGVNFGATTPEQKLAQKANCDNAYTVYKLEFVPEINGNGAWRLVGFGENANRIAVISHLYALLDNDKHPQGVQDDTKHDYSQLINNTDFQHSTDEIFTIDVEDVTPQSGPSSTPIAQEDKGTITITDGQNTIIIAKEDILSALTEADLETNEYLAMLLEYMNDNKIEIFSRANGIVSMAKGNDYVAYIKSSVAAKYVVLVDGVVLPEDAYEIIVLPNGMLRLVIKNSYLKTLSLGSHNLQIKVEGGESVINSTINVLEN